MADVANTVSRLTANLKERYADKINKVLPKGLHLRSDVEFIERSKQPGNTFHQPVLLTHETGFTYANSSAGAFDIEDSRAAEMQDATIVGTQRMLKSVIDYEIAARSIADGRAFQGAAGLVVQNMMDSNAKRDEIDMIHAQRGFRVSSVDDATKVITFKAEDWAPLVWAGMEGTVVEIFSTSAATATKRTLQTSTTASDNNVTTTQAAITAVDIENRKVTFNIGTSTLSATVADTDVVFFRGQKTTTGHNIYAGLHKQIAATTGTVHGINVANYSLWRSTQLALTPAAGNLDFAAFNKAMAIAVGRGLDGDAVAYVNPRNWAGLLDDEVALRRHIGGHKPRFDVGSEGIKFYSQTGEIMIKSSGYVGEGFVYIIAPANWKRVGATDTTFNTPGRGDELFLHLPTKAGYELRTYANWALFTRSLASAVIISGIQVPA